MMMEYYSDKTDYLDNFWSDSDGDGEKDLAFEIIKAYLTSKVNSNFTYGDAYYYEDSAGESFVCYNANGSNVTTEDTIYVGFMLDETKLGIEYCSFEFTDSELTLPTE